MRRRRRSASRPTNWSSKAHDGVRRGRDGDPRRGGGGGARSDARVAGREHPRIGADRRGRSQVPEDAGAALREIHSEARDADIVLVRAGALVADGWLERLLAALDSDSIVMTASALCCPRHGHDLDDAAASIAAGSPRLRPTIPAALGGVCIVRGAGLELVDVRDGELEGLLASLSADLSSFGLVHVLADDVLIEGGDAPTLDDAESDAGSLRPRPLWRPRRCGRSP